MSEQEQAAYQVLARKYRPATFADLIGQDALVRTLKNAFAADRIAQAFIMTGIRGTGKTTTARIISKGMNCIGPDGNGSPTTEPCGVCEHCVAISEGRHVDVMEMDAASRTGVGDIREIIDSVNYRSASARYKIYIIDEVHMLSTSAFNALLKTLEEPPAHVKFIFATTEIRKVPVTVLSRCQRFDLKRIEPEVMIQHLGKVAQLEGAEISEEALGLITRASEGSVRDAMSLLDQAISHGAGETTGEQVRAMLGLADRGRVFDLFELIMKGQAAGALSEFAAQYADGADPIAVLRDLAELTHWISVVQITPEAAEDPTISPDEKARGQQMTAQIPMRALTRMWQMLLKALEEVAIAPNAMMAAEMAIIRLTHVADLPSPEELVRKLQQNPPTGGAPAPQGGMAGSQGGQSGSNRAQTFTPAQHSNGQTALATAPEQALALYASFESVIELLRQRDIKLFFDVEKYLRLVSYTPGRITFEPTQDAPADFAQRLGAQLQNLTGHRWATIIEQGGAPSIQEVQDAAKAKREADARAHPMMTALMQSFPKAEIISIKTAQEIATQAQEDALEEVPDEWDPFEEG